MQLELNIILFTQAEVIRLGFLFLINNERETMKEESEICNESIVYSSSDMHEILEEISIREEEIKTAFEMFMDTVMEHDQDEIYGERDVTHMYSMLLDDFFQIASGKYGFSIYRPGITDSGLFVEYPYADELTCFEL